MPFVHFFLIDVSYNAVTSGALQATCSAVARTLDDLQGMAHVLLNKHHSSCRYQAVM